MKTTKNIGLIILILFSLSSCARKNGAATYNRVSINGKTLAILPYKVVTTGRIPRDVSDEMLEEIETAESQAFQVSLYHQMLDRLGRNRYRDLDLRIQSVTETNQRLETAGISPLESWNIPAEELAAILGVDAVVKSTVHKTKYLTDLESYGIFVARQILANFSNNAYWFVPRNRTSDVRISTTIINAEDGIALWSVSRRCPTDWRNNTYDVIERINFQITRKLPR